MKYLILASFMLTTPLVWGQQKQVTQTIDEARVRYETFSKWQPSIRVQEKPFYKASELKIESQLNQPKLEKLNGGVINGGGGDEVGLEFEKILKAALSALQIRDPLSYDLMVRRGLLDLLKTIRYVVVEGPIQVSLQKDVQTSVAANDRSNIVIYIQRERWQKIAEMRTKEGIAIHEVASLLGLEKTGTYPISAAYISGPVDTVCDSDTKVVDGNGDELSLRITLRNLSVQERYLPALVGISIESLRNGLPTGSVSEPLKDLQANFLIHYGLRNVFNVQSLGDLPQATNPPSGANSMNASPYLLTGQRFDPETYRDQIYTQFVLRSAAGGQAKISVVPAGQFGPYNSFHCSIK